MVNLSFKFVKLTFIKEKADLDFQIRNTQIMKEVYTKYNDKRTLASLQTSTQYGFTAKASSYGNYKLLRITDLENTRVNWDTVPNCDGDCDKYLLKDNDIVIARTGNNKSYLVKNPPKNAIFASYLIRLRVNTNELLPEYLFIFLNSYCFWSQALVLQSGSVLTNVNAEKLKTLEIPYCSIKEQKQIVENYFFKGKLTKEMEKIDKTLSKKEHFDNLNLENEKSIQELRRKILAEAISGKLIEQDLKNEHLSELLKKIHAEKKYIEISSEEIPYTIPKNWSWIRLGDLCDKIGSGSTPRGGKEVYKTKGIKFIRSQNVYNDGLIFSNVAYIDSETHDKMKGTKVIPNDILLNITGGSIGRCALVPSNFDEANVSQHVTIIRLKKGFVNKFIHLVILSPYFQDKIMVVQTGGNREGLAKKNMQLMLIPLPPIEEQRRIVEKVEQLMKLCDTLEEKIKENHKNSEILLDAILKEVFEA